MVQVSQSEASSRVNAAVEAGGIGDSLRSAAMSHHLAQAEQALEAEREVSALEVEREVSDRAKIQELPF